MKKRHLKPWVEYTLIIIVFIQIMLAGSDTELDQVYKWALFQMVNAPLLLLNLSLLGKYGRHIESD